MQQVITLLSSPEQYAEKGLERTVGRPDVCPYCINGAALEAHGYYQRWVSAFEPVGRWVRIRVRRFLSPVRVHRQFAAEFRIDLPGCSTVSSWSGF